LYVLRKGGEDVDKLTSSETKEAGGRHELREYLNVLAQAVASGKVVLLKSRRCGNSGCSCAVAYRRRGGDLLI